MNKIDSSDAIYRSKLLDLYFSGGMTDADIEKFDVLKDQIAFEDQHLYVMAEDPFPNVSPAEISAYFAERQANKDLADALALTWNKFWWVEDNEYDYEEGTPEHKAACAITDEWSALMKEYEKRIFEILANDGIAIPETGTIKVLKPFMSKYGYADRDGWWVMMPDKMKRL